MHAELSGRRSIQSPRPTLKKACGSLKSRFAMRESALQGAVCAETPRADFAAPRGALEQPRPTSANAAPATTHPANRQRHSAKGNPRRDGRGERSDDRHGS